MTMVLDPALVILTFLWIGFVCAISFMEAGLKFQAPGVTLAIGLSIGKLVFGVLNKVEWVLAIAILVNYLLFLDGPPGWQAGWMSMAILILLIQTFWLLPRLNKRASITISSGKSPRSSLHQYYVLLEVVKVIALFVYGVFLFQ